MVLAFVVAFGGCASKSAMTSNAMVYEETAAAYVPEPAAAAYDDGIADYAYPEEMAEEAAVKETAIEEPAEESGFSIGAEEAAETNEKLVYSCYVEMQTVEYEDTLRDIRSLISKYGGIIEQEQAQDNAWNWYYEDYRKSSGTLHMHLVVRIPSENYFDFLNGVSGTEGRILSKNQQVENITRRYSETRTTIESLEIQEKNLLEMMDKAETIEDMLTIEARLSEVQNDLKLYRNSLSEMDTDVAYSTVTLDLSEVLEYKEEIKPQREQTFKDRLKNAFANSWNNIRDFFEGLLFFIIEAGPILIFVGGIITGLVFLILAIVRKWNGKGKKKTELPEKESRKEDK